MAGGEDGRGARPQWRWAELHRGPYLPHPGTSGGRGPVPGWTALPRAGGNRELEEARSDRVHPPAARGRWTCRAGATAGNRGAGDGQGGCGRALRRGDPPRRSGAGVLTHVRWSETVRGVSEMAKKRYIQAI